MAFRFDSADSSLLCTEDSSFFDDNDCYGPVKEEDEEEEFHVLHRKDHPSYCQTQRFNGLPLQSKECLRVLLERERQQLPAGNYLKRLRSGDLVIEARKEAVDWIQKAAAHFGFGPSCLYLSINYLDRFLSAFEIPKDKAWTIQLLAVTCLSLAAKMEETEVPLSLDLQVGESKVFFEAKTIQNMELLVLTNLKWRMQAVTPFSFIDNFINEINSIQLEPPEFSISRSIQLILSTIKGIDFLKFKPSEIAAAVALLASKETPSQVVDSEKAVSILSQHVEKRSIVKCIELIHEMALIPDYVEGGSGSELEVPRSPIGVLDAACFSYQSGGSTIGSHSSSVNSTPKAKRRKLNTADK